MPGVSNGGSHDSNTNAKIVSVQRDSVVAKKNFDDEKNGGLPEKEVLDMQGGVS